MFLAIFAKEFYLYDSDSAELCLGRSRVTETQLFESFRKILSAQEYLFQKRENMILHNIQQCNLHTLKFIAGWPSSIVFKHISRLFPSLGSRNKQDILMLRS
jgi:hypothetical protein